MSVLHTPAANTFRAAAREYCEHIETRHATSPSDWLPRAQRLLVALYAAGLELPIVETDSADCHPSHHTHAEWKRLEENLRQGLGRWNYYREIFDPYAADDAPPVIGSLADDFADIYFDVQRGLTHDAARGTNFPNDEVWEWQFSFISHWGRHATSALYALSTVYSLTYLESAPTACGQWTVARTT